MQKKTTVNKSPVETGVVKKAAAKKVSARSAEGNKKVAKKNSPIKRSNEKPVLNSSPLPLTAAGTKVQITGVAWEVVFRNKWNSPAELQIEILARDSKKPKPTIYSYTFDDSNPEESIKLAKVLLGSIVERTDKETWKFMGENGKHQIVGPAPQ